MISKSQLTAFYVCIKCSLLPNVVAFIIRTKWQIQNIKDNNNKIKELQNKIKKQLSILKLPILIYLTFL